MGLFFGAGKAEGDGGWRDLLGGKGAGLAEMTADRTACSWRLYDLHRCLRLLLQEWQEVSAELKEQVTENVAKLEKIAKKKLGDPRNPLLVSVRSGSARSMPA
jgi:pyruvate,orthophosphate dikinase